IIVAWLFTTLLLNFYEVYRFTSFLKILNLLGKQIIIFALVVYAFFGIVELRQDPIELLEYIIICFVGIAVIKVGIFNLLKKYRILIGGNIQRVVILGENSKTRHLKTFFEKNPAYGYELIKVFDFREKKKLVNEVIDYVIQNDIDEIYCSISEMKNKQIAKIVDFADNNLKVVKFLPDNREIFTKKLDYQYYGISPILSLRTIPIETPFNQFLKRTLDLIISTIVIVLIMSWLTPLVALLIQLESKGPVYFRQKRSGLGNKVFYCYKFRSMHSNENANSAQAKLGDKRITRLGSFLRKSSVDELPQFFNVFLGDMSVVGPRPHMLSHTHHYAASIDKFMVRHFVKPGITGLAQVSGYRGEIRTDDDIKNRVRFDIFYLENWSILMDLRIIIKTALNVVQGEKNAY
ncbi:MAG: exopolysaccharide biosynthesis polyprenyl glycosylphosphotransferase, partial [Leeuwenhoekiella sp.]